MDAWSLMWSWMKFWRTRRSFSLLMSARSFSLSFICADKREKEIRWRSRPLRQSTCACRHKPSVSWWIVMGGSLFIFLLFHYAVNLFFSLLFDWPHEREKGKWRPTFPWSSINLLAFLFLYFLYANRCLITFIGFKTSLDLTDSQAIISFFCAWR